MAVAINFRGTHHIGLVKIIVAYKKGDLNLHEASHLLCNETELTMSIIIGLLSNMTRQNVLFLRMKL